MLFGLFEKKDEGGPPFYIHTIAIPLIVAGIGILAAPDLRDFVLHLLDKVLRTQLDFNQSQATGWVLVELRWTANIRAPTPVVSPAAAYPDATGSPAKICDEACSLH